MPLLLNSQKAELFEIVKAQGFSPASFEHGPGKDERGRPSGFFVRLKKTDYFFVVHPIGGDFQIRYAPGEQYEEERFDSRQWSEASECFHGWLESLRTELNTPDPWDDVAKFSAIVPFSPAQDNPNTAFSYQETQAIWKALGAIQQTLLNEAHDSEEHQALIETQIGFLVESSKTMGRKDWLVIAIGTLVTIAVAMSLSPETGKAIFHILEQAVAGAVHLIGS